MTLADSSQLVSRYVTAALDGDHLQAERTIRAALAEGMDAGQVADRVIAPAMHAVGSRWERGEASIVDEHVATALTIELLGRLPVPAEPEGQPVLSAVVACPQPEAHELGARMVTQTLRADGWSVIYIGAGVPLADLIAFVSLRQPDLLCLSIVLPANLPVAGSAIAMVKRLPRPPAVLLGGYACQSPAVERLSADAVCLQLSELAGLARRLCGRDAG